MPWALAFESMIPPYQSLSALEYLIIYLTLLVLRSTITPYMMTINKW